MLIRTASTDPVTEPTIARLKPYLTTLEGGRTYWWCSCGRSAKQPFCDGSHKGTGFEPLKHVAAAGGEEVLLCACKRTRTAPFCDGAHANLPGGAPLDDPATPENLAIADVARSTRAAAELDGGCFVVAPAARPEGRRGALRYCTLIGAEYGALYQTQMHLEITAAASPVLSFGERDSILFVGSGRGSVTISGRRFEIAPTDGVYVRAGEAFALEAPAGVTLSVYASAGPAGALGFLDAMPANFDASEPVRVVPVDPAQRTAMGARYFQVLVDKRIGSRVITQFIGHIPPSKAAPHRHLYEEALLILSGEGCMWTDTRRTRVAAGDVIFLPRKQVHSLQSLGGAGMDVVGVICPGDNPGINY